MKWIKLLFRKNKVEENGAIVAEATIALSAFIFAIYLVLSIVDICYVQSKMGVALNSAAKEMSQYAYLYETLNMSEYMSGEGGKSSEFMGSFSEVLNKISKGTSNLSADLSNMFSTSAAQAGNDSLAEYLKNGLGMTLAKQLVKKNLVSFEGDTADAFLTRNHVKDGFSGLNFINTTFLTDANQSEINLIVAYKVQVVRLLGTEYTFNFVQRADTKAWGKGVSLKNPSSNTTSTTASIWDASNLSRGNSIITSEKKNYKYTSSGNNFHAYDDKNNQFIRIRSINTFDKSYSSQGAIESQLNSTYKTLKSGVEDLDKKITVKNSSDKDVTLTSNKDTRTYKIVLVVPEGADMTTINSAVTSFKASNPGVDVEVKAGYGTPTPQTADNKEKENTE